MNGPGTAPDLLGVYSVKCRHAADAMQRSPHIAPRIGYLLARSGSLHMNVAGDVAALRETVGDRCVLNLSTCSSSPSDTRAVGGHAMQKIVVSVAHSGMPAMRQIDVVQ